MRSFLGFLVFTAALVAILAVFLVPPVVAPIVVTAVREASPFGDQALDVEVDVDALGLMRGFVGEIRISGSDLEARGVTIDALDVTVQGVEIGGDHDFAGVDGAFGGLVVLGGADSPVEVRALTVSGPSTDVTATATLVPEQALILVRDSLADAGVDASDVELVDGGVAFQVAGQRLEVALVVNNGAIVVPMFGSSPVPVLAPDASDSWRITAVSVDPTGLEIEASVDAVALLAN